MKSVYNHIFFLQGLYQGKVIRYDTESNYGRWIVELIELGYITIDCNIIQDQGWHHTVEITLTEKGQIYSDYLKL